MPPRKALLFPGQKLFLLDYRHVSSRIELGGLCLRLFQQDQETRIDEEFVLSTCYDLSLEDVGYVPYAFFRTVNFQQVIRMDNMIGVIHHLTVMQISLIIVFYYGIKTYRKIISVKGTSKKTRDLQHQLFAALVVQTTIPLIFIFVPNTVLSVAAFVNGNFGGWANVTVVMNHLYPAADPFVILFIIRGFRTRIKKFLLCGKRSKTSVSTIHTHRKHEQRSHSSNIY